MIEVGEDIVCILASDDDRLFKDIVCIFFIENIFVNFLTLFPNHDHRVYQSNFFLSQVRVDSICSIWTDDILLIKRVISVWRSFSITSGIVRQKLAGLGDVTEAVVVMICLAAEYVGLTGEGMLDIFLREVNSFLLWS
jgi:hypothetical protein